eukprot:TRINITY_DN107364_c0_g1_i1.p1 TRINITY_DN107364_c0_g1~~TRINITY_DN107364_c0_g1_i1.p1  ORF type:complete len:182 (-),score=37.08 TRINITY_DN107364_c0_g1_i1:164-709(-)
MALSFGYAVLAAVICQAQQATFISVSIDGTEVKDEKCFEAKSSDGLVAEISSVGLNAEKTVVYDADASCGERGAYIHYAGGEGGFKPMTAGSGPLIHTYHAILLSGQNLEEAKARVGECSDVINTDLTKMWLHQDYMWKVAAVYRGGSCRRRRRRDMMQAWDEEDEEGEDSAKQDRWEADL